MLEVEFVVLLPVYLLLIVALFFFGNLAEALAPWGVAALPLQQIARFAIERRS